MPASSNAGINPFSFSLPTHETSLRDEEQNTLSFSTHQMSLWGHGIIFLPGMESTIMSPKKMPAEIPVPQQPPDIQPSVAPEE